MVGEVGMVVDHLSEEQPVLTDITYVNDDDTCRRRRRHPPRDGDYYVVHPCSKLLEEHDDGIILPQGNNITV